MKEPSAIAVKAATAALKYWGLETDPNVVTPAAIAIEEATGIGELVAAVQAVKESSFHYSGFGSIQVPLEVVDRLAQAFAKTTGTSSAG
jgi:hypothetical protein